MSRALVLVMLLTLMAQQTVLADCLSQPPSGEPQYVRKHKVYNFNGEPPSWLEDTLVLWKSNAGETCFALDTWGSNGHECGAQGVLDQISERNYRFNAGTCSINLALKGPSIDLVVAGTWRRSGAGGTCPPRFQCGMFGSVESGRFTQQ